MQILFQVGRPEIDTLILLDREVRLSRYMISLNTKSSLKNCMWGVNSNGLLYFLFQVDMVTPMCTQLTYEGLLNEVMPQNLDTAVLTKVVLLVFRGRATGLRFTF